MEKEDAVRNAAAEHFSARLRVEQLKATNTQGKTFSELRALAEETALAEAEMMKTYGALLRAKDDYANS